VKKILNTKNITVGPVF